MMTKRRFYSRRWSSAYYSARRISIVLPGLQEDEGRDGMHPDEAEDYILEPQVTPRRIWSSVRSCQSILLIRKPSVSI